MLGKNTTQRKSAKKKSPNSYSGPHNDSQDITKGAHQEACSISCSHQRNSFCVDINQRGFSKHVIDNNHPNITPLTGDSDNIDTDLLNNNSNGLDAGEKSNHSYAHECHSHDSHDSHSNTSDDSDDIAQNNNPNISRSTSVSSFGVGLESEDLFLEQSNSIGVAPTNDTLASSHDKINNSSSKDEHTAKKPSILTSLKEKMYLVWTAIYNYLKPFFESIYNKFIGKKKDIKNNSAEEKSTIDGSTNTESDSNHISTLNSLTSIVFSSATSKNNHSSNLDSNSRNSKENPSL